MSLIGHDRFLNYDSLHRLENPRLVSGGSAANTTVGVVALGGSASFVGRVFDDHLGRAFRDDILAAGVEYEQALASKGLSTASSIIFVTPDAERSMKTFLGASIELEPQDINNIDLDQAKIIYLEGYLFDAPSGSKIFSEVARKANECGKKLALSLSDPECVKRHKIALTEFIVQHVSILFGNEEEVLELKKKNHQFKSNKLEFIVEELVITQGSLGANLCSSGDNYFIEPMPQGPVIDTTGAGDLFAAGYLYGRTNGYDIPTSGNIAAFAAGEVITQIGARPNCNFKSVSKIHYLFDYQIASYAASAAV